MTGWIRGPCVGFGRGFAGHRGFCGFFARQRLSPTEERTALTEEAQEVSEYLRELRTRLKELEEE